MEELKDLFTPYGEVGFVVIWSSLRILDGSLGGIGICLSGFPRNIAPRNTSKRIKKESSYKDKRWEVEGSSKGPWYTDQGTIGLCFREERRQSHVEEFCTIGLF